MYGVGTDDAHRYHTFAPKQANPNRSWIMVRARHLTPESIITAMNAGDFYCSTGATLKDVTFENNTLTVQIDPDTGVTIQDPVHRHATRLRSEERAGYRC